MRTVAYFVSIVLPTMLLVTLQVLAKSRYFFQQAREIDPGILITRATTADIPANESLVRPSSQSMMLEETNALLLRASIETSEKHKEQLLRASTGQEEGAEWFPG